MSAVKHPDFSSLTPNDDWLHVDRAPLAASRVNHVTYAELVAIRAFPPGNLFDDHHVWLS